MVEIPDVLIGYNVMPIDKSELDSDAYILACRAQNITYGLGDKDPVLGAFPPDYSCIDCSGFMRTFVYYLTNGEIKLPDGSWNQLDYFKSNNFKPYTFSETGSVDNIVRVAVYEQSGHTGHIWMTYRGRTYESHGSAGPSHRDWDVPVLASLAALTQVFAVA